MPRRGPNPFLRAADYIRDHGWAKNTFQAKDGSVCAIGALRKSNNMWRPVSPQTVEKRDRLEVFCDAVLAKRQGKSWIEVSVMDYNDCEARDADEVIHFLKECAEEWELSKGDPTKLCQMPVWAYATQ